MGKKRGEYRLVKEYEYAKGEIAAFIKEMNQNVAEIKMDIDEYLNEGVESSRLEFFNLEKSLKIVRTWEIIISDKIRVCDRNIICAYVIADCDPSTCLSFFNGKGKNIKNVATLNTLIYNARKAIKDIYYEMYG